MVDTLWLVWRQLCIKKKQLKSGAKTSLAHKQFYDTMQGPAQKAATATSASSSSTGPPRALQVQPIVQPAVKSSCSFCCRANATKGFGG
eukprot:5140004-Amphidinium_carterae.1